MILVKPEFIKDITKERKEAIMRRSMEDISSVYLEVRDIVMDIQKRGDIVSLEHYKKFKDNICPDDLVVTRDEIDKAYESLDEKVIEKLKIAAKNIEKFHKAQLEREMWSMEIMEGIVAGRLTRAMDTIGAYLPGRKAMYGNRCSRSTLFGRIITFIKC